ncbi:MAG: leucyl aminopeptidase [Pseudomonadota bacterium]
MTTTKLIRPQIHNGSYADLPCEVLVLPVFEDGSMPAVTKEVDRFLKGFLARQIKFDRFEGEKGKVLWVKGPGMKAPRVLLTGLGSRAEFGRDAVRDAFGTASQQISIARMRDVGIPAFPGADLAKYFDAAVEGFLLGTYRFLHYKEKKEKERSIESITLSPSDGRTQAWLAKSLPGILVGVEAVYMARDWINEPANVVTPSYLEREASRIAKEQGLKIRVFDETELRKRGMNLILAVGMGSRERPRFVHMEYVPKGRARRKVAFVGKGVTFDSGGLSLKTQDYMYGMKADMSGAAAVLAAMWAVARLKPSIHVHGVFPLVENVPSGHSVKPGDVVIGHNGKSVEIENTDAEGRLILADALSYISAQDVDEVIDVATLTGACQVALGEDIAGIFTANRALGARIEKAAAHVGEKVWALPMEMPYKRHLKSDVADVKNVGSRYGGAITAAIFLSEFVKEGTPWAHLDIAGPAFVSHEWPTAAKGATGFAVRTFLKMLAD